MTESDSSILVLLQTRMIKCGKVPDKLDKLFTLQNIANLQGVGFTLDLALLPNSGEVMIRGALCGRGVRIQKSWLRESIQRVDPTRRERIVYDFS